MGFDTTAALGAMTGARYIESLKDGREVWLDGEKVQDVTTYPAFTGMVHELARIYDLQHIDVYRDQMTFISPATGQRCSLSWLLPRSRGPEKEAPQQRTLERALLGAAWAWPRYPGPVYHYAV
jgi:aromatic ring hydroxylase